MDIVVFVLDDIDIEGTLADRILALQSITSLCCEALTIPESAAKHLVFLVSAAKHCVWNRGATCCQMLNQQQHESTHDLVTDTLVTAEIQTLANKLLMHHMKHHINIYFIVDHITIIEISELMQMLVCAWQGSQAQHHPTQACPRSPSVQCHQDFSASRTRWTTTKAGQAGEHLPEARGQ